MLKGLNILVMVSGKFFWSSSSMSCSCGTSSQASSTLLRRNVRAGTHHLNLAPSSFIPSSSENCRAQSVSRQSRIRYFTNGREGATVSL